MAKNEHHGKRTRGLLGVIGGLAIAAGAVLSINQARASAAFYGGGAAGWTKALSPTQLAGDAPSNKGGFLNSELAKTLAPVAVLGTVGIAAFEAGKIVSAAQKAQEFRIGGIRIGA